MSTFFFVLLHILAVVFGMWGLLVTIPLHMIYASLQSTAENTKPKTDEAAATPQTHVRCPDCRELVRHDARKCKHCGVALIPQ